MSKATPPKICPICRKVFTPKYKDQKLCSRECNGAWMKLSEEERVEVMELVAKLEKSYELESAVVSDEGKVLMAKSEVASEDLSAVPTGQAGLSAVPPGQADTEDVAADSSPPPEVTDREISHDVPRIDWSKSWDKISLLDVDPDIKEWAEKNGMALRWVDTGEAWSEPRHGKLSLRQLEGWVVVHAKERKQYDTEGSAPIDTTVRRRELILCTMPQERVKERNRKVAERGQVKLKEEQDAFTEAKAQYEFARQKARGTSKIISIPKNLGK